MSLFEGYKIRGLEHELRTVSKNLDSLAGILGYSVYDGTAAPYIDNVNERLAELERRLSKLEPHTHVCSRCGRESK